jgi:phenazine biosynthesis protein phzE
LSAFSFDEPYCIFNKGGRSGATYVATGRMVRVTRLDDVPRPPPRADVPVSVISMVPYAQIRERGFRARDAGEPILSLVVERCVPCTLDDLAPAEGAPIELAGPVTFDVEDPAFMAMVESIIEKEIKNGEGSNFLISRKCHARFRAFDSGTANTILRRFIENEFGAYVNFCLFDGEAYFIGSSPERHLTFTGEVVEMNPISGTLPKSSLRSTADLMKFVTDPKEINELFQVVDEELKMMSRICKEGGDIHGPFFKEMRTLIHTEYLLKGISHIDKIEAFRLSMFAATMIGSPLENAARIIERYEPASRGYYSSAVLFLGSDEAGGETLDSAITIRTMQVRGNDCVIQSGASIVRDSVPHTECLEVRAKAEGMIRAITSATRDEPQLARYTTPEVTATLEQRNLRLSRFWLEKQGTRFAQAAAGRGSILIMDNEDEFTFMMKHMFDHMGVAARVVRHDAPGLDVNGADLVLVGPGPGDPTNLDDPKMRRVHGVVDGLLRSGGKFLAVCLGHQVLCHQLGLSIAKLDPPLQGVQKPIDLFGREESVGFYNTFAAVRPDAGDARDTGRAPGVEIWAEEDGRVNALRAPSFVSFQFHLESVLTTNGFDILKDAVEWLVR